MGFKIHNRRYTGSKQKLVIWIRNTIKKECSEGCTSFCDLFAGTGVVTNAVSDDFSVFYINDFLYSNYCIYNAFFGNEAYSEEKIIRYKRAFVSIKPVDCKENYVSINFGDKFFSKNDSLLIGEIRERIELLKKAKEINQREYDILLASLIYSFDRCSNTVGHYEAYIKKPIRKDSFEFELIDPIVYSKEEKRVFNITRMDSNVLARNIEAEIVYIDPPYSSRQYSRFYHVIETITKWDKPKLYGTALKPEPENMSDYCSSIIVSYNNTYNSKSNSSKNKMELKDMLSILKKKGETKVLEMKHNAFNAGKTEMSDHKEILFVTEVFHE